MKTNQKEAVYNAIRSVLAENNISFEDGSDVSTYMTREYRAVVNQILFEGFRAGNIELDREFTDTELKSYVSGLQSNWIRKDKRLNGNTQYVAKNPGSRAGAGDAQLKAMRALLATLSDAGDRAEVETAIAQRVAEIDASKPKAQVDVSKLPDALKKFIKG